MWRRRREPLFTFAVRSERPRCTVVFEPVGSLYELAEDDEIVIHVFERSATDAPDGDLEIYHADEQIQLWLPPWKYRVWNKAGEELQV
jgi:hypothetical protein